MISTSSRIADYIMFARSVRILALSLCLLAFIVWWKVFGDQGKVIQVLGLDGVVSVRTKSNYLITLDDGRKVSIPGRGLLREGVRVRLLQRTFEKGEPEISLSVEAEAMGGDS